MSVMRNHHLNSSRNFTADLATRTYHPQIHKLRKIPSGSSPSALVGLKRILCIVHDLSPLTDGLDPIAIGFLCILSAGCSETRVRSLPQSKGYATLTVTDRNITCIIGQNDGSIMIYAFVTQCIPWSVSSFYFNLVTISSLIMGEVWYNGICCCSVQHLVSLMIKYTIQI